MSQPILALHQATKHFSANGRAVRSLDGVDLELRRGETLGLVGESGCGKSTLAKAVMRLFPLTRGRIDFDGEDISRLEGKAQLAQRARLQMVFQDPFASLNPRSSVGRILEEPLIVHRRGTSGERREQVALALQRVGLRPEMAARYPHEFSGGQRQRIGIARAMMLQPEVLLCDEAVSALDVSVRAQVLNLLLDLRRESGAACLFISHDLSVVHHMSDRVVVMYLGRVVEQASREDLWREPLHPYTRALMAAVPKVVPRRAGSAPATAAPPLVGELPSPIAPPSGWHFHPRCPLAQARCRSEAPPLRHVGPHRVVACHLV